MGIVNSREEIWRKFWNSGLFTGNKKQYFCVSILDTFFVTGTTITLHKLMLLSTACPNVLFKIISKSCYIIFG